MTGAVTTVLGLGRLPGAPGTWGSAAAVPAAWVIHGLLGFPGLFAVTLLVFALGWWATAEALRHTDDEDPSEIVIDEVAGQWIALWPLSGGLWHAGVDPWIFPWPGWVGAFVMFRLFDIWKPGPVGWADRRGGAAGVMLDDAIAGLFAAVVVAAAAAVSHGGLGL